MLHNYPYKQPSKHLPAWLFVQFERKNLFLERETAIQTGKSKDKRSSPTFPRSPRGEPVLARLGAARVSLPHVSLNFIDGEFLQNDHRLDSLLQVHLRFQSLQPHTRLLPAFWNISCSEIFPDFGNGEVFKHSRTGVFTQHVRKKLCWFTPRLSRTLHAEITEPTLGSVFLPWGIGLMPVFWSMVVLVFEGLRSDPFLWLLRPALSLAGGDGHAHAGVLHSARLRQAHLQAWAAGTGAGGAGLLRGEPVPCVSPSSSTWSPRAWASCASCARLLRVRVLFALLQRLI